MNQQIRRRLIATEIALVIALPGAPIVALLWGMQPGNPYGYFTFLRVIICFFAFVFFALSSGQRRELQALLFIGIGILFNPFFPVHLTRFTWLVIDTTTIVAFIVGTWFWVDDLRRKPRQGD